MNPLIFVWFDGVSPGGVQPPIRYIFVGFCQWENWPWIPRPKMRDDLPPIHQCFAVYYSHLNEEHDDSPVEHDGFFQET